LRYCALDKIIMEKSFFYRKQNQILLVLVPLWFILYFNLSGISNFIIDALLKLPKGEHLTETLRFFIFEVPKVLLLLTLIIFVVGIVRTYFSPERTRRALEGKSRLTGNLMGGMLGIVTPFCSCSAIPLFLGFVESGVPLGATFSFLIAAPMINEVAIVLLLGMFGLKVTAIYILSGLSIAILSGWVIGKLNPTHWVADWVYKTKFEGERPQEEKMDMDARILAGFTAVKEIVGKVWVYVLAGIAVGAAAHGYVPEDFMVSVMDKSHWYAVPLSVAVGVPLYSNAAGIIPIVSVLIEKGVPLGTALAFMMAVIGLSLPELIILKKVLKWQFIAAFVSIVTVGILITGYLFNAIL
jgi:uncharacterized protein